MQTLSVICLEAGWVGFGYSQSPWSERIGVDQNRDARKRAQLFGAGRRLVFVLSSLQWPEVGKVREGPQRECSLPYSYLPALCGLVASLPCQTRLDPAILWGSPSPALPHLPAISHSSCSQESREKCYNQSVHTLNILMALASLLLVASREWVIWPPMLSPAEHQNILFAELYTFQVLSHSLDTQCKQMGRYQDLIFLWIYGVVYIY